MSQAPRALGPVVLALACLCLASCEALKQPAPDKVFFAIDAGTPAAGASTAGNRVLRVRRLHVAKPYDARTFLYKVAESRFESDYYNGFVVSPAENLTAELIRWLSTSGACASVVDASSSVAHTHVLEGSITALYGDYADKSAPKAIIEAKFFLLDDTGAEPRVLLQKAYAGAAPLGGEGPAALVEAWGKAWRQVLVSLAADLANADLRQGGAAPSKADSQVLPEAAWHPVTHGRQAMVHR